MKIGIIGGTFDPVHNGHLMLGDYAYQKFQLDQIWFMPNGNPPHKQNTGILTSAEDRAAMVKLCIEGKHGFRVEEYEVNRTELSYTYQTMEYFKQKYPENQFYFIIGADSLFAIDTWVHPERIFPCCTILAAFRDKMDKHEIMENQIHLLKEKYPKADIRLLATPLVHLASHELREKLKNGYSISGEVPDVVENYIRDHHLYQL